MPTTRGDPDKEPKASTSTTTAVSTSTTSTSSSSSTQRTVVRTDGGSIEVAGNGDVLEVLELTTNEGWEVQVDRPDDRRLIASFTGAAGRAEVTIVLTENGIQTSTRSMS